MAGGNVFSTVYHVLAEAAFIRATREIRGDKMPWLDVINPGHGPPT
jgi:hypothetical protein